MKYVLRACLFLIIATAAASCAPQEPKYGKIIDKTYDDPDDEFKMKQVPSQNCGGGGSRNGDTFQCSTDYEFKYIYVRDEAHYNLVVETPDGKRGKVEVSEAQWNAHNVGDCWIKCK